MKLREIGAWSGHAPLRLGIAAAVFSAASWALGASAFAASAGHPEPGQMTFEQAVTPIAEEMHFFHNWILLPIITGICLLVLALLIYVMVKFNEKANPTPSRLTHHTGLEVAWTVIPVMILVVIAVPSFRLLAHQLILPDADMTLKVTGHQWYWSYQYPADQGGFSFDSLLKDDKDLNPQNGDIHLLAVDNEAVVPVNKTILVQVTASDVIHSFVIQSFGIRIDAVPGRLNETWFKAEREGLYYGQCSIICGINHAFMPIAFRVVSQDQYQAWLADAKKKFASATENKYAGAPDRIAVAENAAATPTIGR
jgi:cytochrome c oxidase subunit 2